MLTSMHVCAGTSPHTMYNVQCDVHIAVSRWQNRRASPAVAQSTQRAQQAAASMLVQQHSGRHKPRSSSRYGTAHNRFACDKFPGTMLRSIYGGVEYRLCLLIVLSLKLRVHEGGFDGWPSTRSVYTCTPATCASCLC